MGNQGENTQQEQQSAWQQLSRPKNLLINVMTTTTRQCAPPAPVSPPLYDPFCPPPEAPNDFQIGKVGTKTKRAKQITKTKKKKQKKKGGGEASAKAMTTKAAAKEQHPRQQPAATLRNFEKQRRKTSSNWRSSSYCSSNTKYEAIRAV